MNKRIIGVIIALVLVLGGGIAYKFSKEKSPEDKKADITYSTDTTLTGDSEVPVDALYRIENGATLTVDGNYSVNGTLDCANGALNVTVNGDLLVDGTLRCVRSEEIEESDLGEGLRIVVNGEIEFTENSVVSTNGHVQLVTDANELADNIDELDNIYENVETIIGVEDIFVVGPFIDIPLAEGQGAMLKPSEPQNPIAKTLVNTAYAQDPATDVDGNIVKDTVRIGGKWVIGDPRKVAPKRIQVPVPPKKIKKIIINWSFGPTGTVAISNLTLYGPDGRPGTDDTGSCTVKGDAGNNAYRLNVSAGNITINNFDLFLGYGGAGGFAETSKDCEHGRATGGKGGKPGNLKMIAQNKFEIKGAFTINPGHGGAGGQAVAHGKNGADGCPAEDGGKATATGGEGGENKKGLRILGTVAGTDNVTIKALIGGNGGDADANGGTGGNGNACGCDGGAGGDATATGGKGGTATSRTVESKGGDGGGVTAIPGIGGNGGMCDHTGPGGDGAKGGDAKAKVGKPGTGRTSNGDEGTNWGDEGGNGGNGGDGCVEGKGAKGGSGNPDGEDGKDGENLCITITKEEDSQIDIPDDEVSVPNGLDDEVEVEIVPLSLVSVEPLIVNFTYDHAKPKCPLQLPPIHISGPPDMQWDVMPEGGDFPIWLQPIGPDQGNGPGQINLAFPCQLDNYNNQQQHGGLHVNVQIPNDGFEDSFHVDINGNFTNFDN